MDDFSFWWYIIAAVIYFLTRGKKKKQQQQPNSRPGSERNPTPQSQPKSFEDLLREITEGRREEEPTIQQEPVTIEQEEETEEDNRRLEGERRAFADEESRRVYEDSIKMAEGSDIEFARDEHYEEPRLFKGGSTEEEEEWSIADEIRDGLNSSEAKKAVIYSEILTRKY